MIGSCIRIRLVVILIIVLGYILFKPAPKVIPYNYVPRLEQIRESLEKVPVVNTSDLYLWRSK